MLWGDEWLLPAREKSALRYKKKTWGKSWPGPRVLQRRAGSGCVVSEPMQQGFVKATNVGRFWGGTSAFDPCKSNEGQKLWRDRRGDFVVGASHRWWKLGWDCPCPVVLARVWHLAMFPLLNTRELGRAFVFLMPELGRGGQSTPR